MLWALSLSAAFFKFLKWKHFQTLRSSIHYKINTCTEASHEFPKTQYLSPIEHEMCNHLNECNKNSPTCILHMHKAHSKYWIYMQPWDVNIKPIFRNLYRNSNQTGIFNSISLERIDSNINYRCMAQLHVQQNRPERKNLIELMWISILCVLSSDAKRIPIV